ncbi:hypothetical protein DL763_004136 [Monosporascus cannonballus]|nr:hypothetical protein DL763_004136 [Monosporascus cannonballus]
MASLKTRGSPLCDLFYEKLWLRRGLSCCRLSEHHFPPLGFYEPLVIRATAERIFDPGLASLQRKGSLRNHAPVFSEIHKPLTSAQKEYGIVYVLGHKIEKGLFKIGWTRVTAEERLNQAGNCYGFNAEILHETRGGPFFAESKAEKFAQTVLRHHNLTIVECERCGGGHREWFRAPKEMVVETVEIMETFVRLPAYESKDGQTWRLSDAAYEMIRTMCDFSTVRLSSPIATIERHPINEPPGGVSTQLKPEAVAHVAETAFPARSQDSDEGMEGYNPSATTAAVNAGKGTKGAARSVGADAARRAKGALRKAAELKDRVSQFRNRSREGTPELDGDGKRENFREPRRGVSWVKTMKYDLRAFITDFEVEWKRDDEECRERPASKESK